MEALTPGCSSTCGKLSILSVFPGSRCGLIVVSGTSESSLLVRSYFAISTAFFDSHPVVVQCAIVIRMATVTTIRAVCLMDLKFMRSQCYLTTSLSFLVTAFENMGGTISVDAFYTEMS